MDIAVVLGTRPQIIKSAPVIKKLASRRGCKLHIIHTGQHYDFELSKVFFNEMSLPNPELNLGVREDSHAKQTAAMMVKLERGLSKLDPDIVLVPGDTNSALAAALVSVKLRIPLAHLEAGPRQFDISNPEEANRIVVDHLSTLAFAPSPSSVRNLRREGFRGNRLQFTGDTMLDCLIEHIGSAKKIDIESTFGLEAGFVLTTIHRQENTENAEKLKGVVNSIVSDKQLRFAFPVHPRTRRFLKLYGLWKRLATARNVSILPPVSYENNLALLLNARLVMTDSGGLQKEAFWVGVPCVTVFKSTPWPETLFGRANRCTEPETDSLVSALHQAERVEVDIKRSSRMFGDGHASEKVCNSLLAFRS